MSHQESGPRSCLYLCALRNGFTYGHFRTGMAGEPKEALYDIPIYTESQITRRYQGPYV